MNHHILIIGLVVLELIMYYPAGNWWLRSAALYDSPGHIPPEARYFCAYAYDKANRLEALGYYEYNGIHSYDSDVAVVWWLRSAYHNDASIPASYNNSYRLILYVHINVYENSSGYNYPYQNEYYHTYTLYGGKLVAEVCRL